MPSRAVLLITILSRSDHHMTLIFLNKVVILEAQVQMRSATLINGLGWRDAIASEPLDRQVKVAWNELHTPHPTRTIPNCHP